MKSGNKSIKILTTYTLGLVAVLTLIIYRLLPYDSTMIEYGFSRGVFMIFRSVWDYTIGFLPFGFIYILIFFVLLYWIRSFFISASKKQKGYTFFRRFVNVISVAIITFYWLWGFNYKRYNFRQVTGLTEETPAPSFVFDEYCRVSDSLLVLHTSLDESDWVEQLPSESVIRQDLEQILRLMDLPNAGRVRIRKIKPKGSLLHISTAGVYLPFTGEGHIDAGLHPLTHPFTMMHEMAHGYGWTGEDVCNFLALLGTTNSQSPFIRYSGYMSYWRYLRSQIYQLDRERFDTFYRAIPPGIEENYMEILEYARRYPDIMPKIRDIFYDQYLRSHGISSGLVNYSQMILLSNEWQRTYGSLSMDSITKVNSKNISD